jgi:hypothetical protein
MTWQREFDEPIPLPNGRALETLSDARAYILRLKKADQCSEPWQTAVEALLMAAEGRGPMMPARIGVLRALNRNVERAFSPGRRDHHWGKRKLARDR